MCLGGTISSEITANSSEQIAGRGHPAGSGEMLPYRVPGRTARQRNIVNCYGLLCRNRRPVMVRGYYSLAPARRAPNQGPAACIAACRSGLRRFALHWTVLLLLACTAYAHEAPFLRSGQRILFLGDSITQDGRYVENIEAVLLTRFPNRKVEIFKLGLSSETVSGLTEPGHPYPRPNVHNRLAKALELTRPTVVTMCYGMNDGIYHPFSLERFQAFRKGMRKLIEKVKAAGAVPVVFTPPPFDPLPKKVTAPAGASQFGYQTPYKDYDSVLERYSKWLLSLRRENIAVVDLHTPMEEYLTAQRKKDPGYVLAKDGVHPGATGHWIMAQTILRAWGVDVEEPPPEKVRNLVTERWRVLGPSLRSAVGNPLPKASPGLPLEEARKQAAVFEARAREAARQQDGNRR